jgi:hypothetical protein
MSTNQVSPQSGESGGGSQEVDGAIQPCPLTECAALIYCVGGPNNFAVKGIDAEVTNGPATKPTNDEGLAEFLKLKPPNQDYTAKVTLKDDDLKKYIWKDTDAASTQTTRYIAGADEGWFKFRLIFLARPKVRVLWQADNSAIKDVGVKLKQADADKYTLSNTGPDGIAKTADTDKGVKPGDYTVDFPTGIDHCEVVEDPGITIVEDGAKTYTFHIVKFYVSFQLKDQFTQAVSGLDWVLLYPDKTKKDTGKFGDPDAGTIKKDQIPKGDYIFSVKLVFDPEWDDDALEIGKDAKMSASATGFDANTDVKFEIFDSCVISGGALDTVTGKTGADPNNPVVEVVWKPDADKLKKVTSGAVVFVASVGALKTTSEAVPISGKQTFDVKDASGSPLETQVFCSFCSGGQVIEKTETSTGGKAEPLVPLGATLLSVLLTGQKGALAKFTDSGKTQGFVVPAEA